MRKLYVVGMTFLLVLSGSSCSAIKGGGDSSLTREAERQARDYWEAGFTKCGDFYYANSHTGGMGMRILKTLLQYKKLDVTVESKPLSEADKLNGIEWKGESALNPVAYREYVYKLEKWDDWRNGVPQGPAVRVTVRKQNGQWHVGENIVVNEMKYEKIDCKDIPQ